MANLAIQQLTSDSTPHSGDESNSCRLIAKRLACVDKNLQAIVNEVESAASSSSIDTSLLLRYEEQLSGLKSELSCASCDALALVDDEANLSEQLSEVSKAVFNVCQRIKRLCQRHMSISLPLVEGEGLRQKYSQESSTVPHLATLLEFVNLWAQASKSTAPEFGCVPSRKGYLPRSVTSLTTTVDDQCIVCKAGKHPLYSCQKFKSLPHDQMISTLKSNYLCINCLTLC